MRIYRWNQAIDLTYKRAMRLLSRPWSGYSMTATNPPTADVKPAETSEQQRIDSAVATAVAAQPPAPAAQPTNTQVSSAVVAYLTANAASFKGEPGVAAAAVQLQRKEVATPALALLASQDVTVTWDVPFKQSTVEGVVVPASTYEVFVEVLGGALGKLHYTVKSQTATAVVITVSAVLAVGAGSLKVRGLHL